MAPVRTLANALPLHLRWLPSPYARPEPSTSDSSQTVSALFGGHLNRHCEREFTSPVLCVFLTTTHISACLTDGRLIHMQAQQPHQSTAAVSVDAALADALAPGGCSLVRGYWQRYLCVLDTRGRLFVVRATATQPALVGIAPAPSAVTSVFPSSAGAEHVFGVAGGLVHSWRIQVRSKEITLEAAFTSSSLTGTVLAIGSLPGGSSNALEFVIAGPPVAPAQGTAAGVPSAPDTPRSAVDSFVSDSSRVTLKNVHGGRRARSAPRVAVRHPLLSSQPLRTDALHLSDLLITATPRSAAATPRSLGGNASLLSSEPSGLFSAAPSATDGDLALADAARVSLRLYSASMDSPILIPGIVIAPRVPPPTCATSLGDLLAVGHRHQCTPAAAASLAVQTAALGHPSITVWHRRRQSVMSRVVAGVPAGTTIDALAFVPPHGGTAGGFVCAVAVFPSSQFHVLVLTLDAIVVASAAINPYATASVGDVDAMVGPRPTRDGSSIGAVFLAHDVECLRGALSPPFAALITAGTIPSVRGIFFALSEYPFSRPHILRQSIVATHELLCQGPAGMVAQSACTRWSQRFVSSPWRIRASQVAGSPALVSIASSVGMLVASLVFLMEDDDLYRSAAVAIRLFAFLGDMPASIAAIKVLLPLFRVPISPIGLDKVTAKTKRLQERFVALAKPIFEHCLNAKDVRAAGKIATALEDVRLCERVFFASCTMFGITPSAPVWGAGEKSELYHCTASDPTAQWICTSCLDRPSFSAQVSLLRAAFQSKLSSSTRKAETHCSLLHDLIFALHTSHRFGPLTPRSDSSPAASASSGTRSVHSSASNATSTASSPVLAGSSPSLSDSPATGPTDPTSSVMEETANSTASSEVTSVVESHCVDSLYDTLEAAAIAEVDLSPAEAMIILQKSLINAELQWDEKARKILRAEILRLEEVVTLLGDLTIA